MNKRNEKLKVLNLFAGIGGNRKLWKDVEVTAVENNDKIAKIYSSFFPEDKVIIADAHEYLLKHFDEFDFIWSSPPCTTHSRIRLYTSVARGQAQHLYPDMTLYQEILFLQENCPCKFVIENVVPYYPPLIAGQRCGRHIFWANFKINNKEFPDEGHEGSIIRDIAKIKGLTSDFPSYGLRKLQLLRNAVNAELGLHIFKCAFKDIQSELSSLNTQGDKL